MTSTDWAVIAVIIDSIVTLYVGWRLNRTAKQEAGKAVDTIKPALVTELSNAASALIPLLIPLIVKEIKKHIDDERDIDATIRPISSHGE